MSKNLITYSDFMTRDKKFYYVKDIKFTLKSYNIDSKGKKNELIKRLSDFYIKLKEYQKYKNQIILIQKVYRGYKLRNRDILRGPGFFNLDLCKNEEDFFNMEKLDNIPKHYLFSYRDDDKNIWGFDIRSLKKLIESNSNNPYTRGKIPFSVKNNLRKIVKILQKNNYEVDFEEIKLTPEQKFKNDVLNIFQKIDSLNVAAGGTDVNWFNELNLYQLRNLYKHLEDIWNYRAELTINQQNRIVPGREIFKYPIKYITSINDKRKLQNILLAEIDKLISSSNYESDCSTGAYYFLIGLCEVSSTCANVMPWLAMTNNQVY